MKKAHTYLSAEEKRAAMSELSGMFGEHDSLWIGLNKGSALVAKWAERLNPEAPHAISILDCGASNGHLLKQLRDNGFTKLYAADFDNFLTDKSMAEFHAVDFNFEKLPFADNSLDMVVCFETMEHMENPFHFEREVHRILKPGGIFIASMPNVYHLFNKLVFLLRGDMFRYHERNDHLTLFPKSVFNKIFLRHFDLLEVAYDRGEFPYRWFSKLSYPQNELFGRSICRVLQKKA